MVVCLSIIVIGGGFLLYLRFVDGIMINRPLVIEDSLNIKVLKESYRPGETVQAYMSFCKERNIVATVQWSLINTILTQYPSRPSSVQKGCHKNIIVNLEPIPMDALPGAHYFEGTVTYEVNPLNTISYYLKTNSFQIIK